MAGSSGLWAVFSLCNGELEDEGRQGHTHSTCHGTDAATPSVRRRTAAAPAVRRHCDTSEPEQWRAAKTPAVRHPTTPPPRLKVFSQATTRTPLRRHGIGSRFSLNEKPGADHCGPGEVYRRLLPRRDRVSLGAAADRIPPPGGGPNASTKVEPANDRPSPRSVLIQMSTQLVVSNHRAGLPATGGAGWASPIQSQRICSHAI